MMRSALVMLIAMTLGTFPCRAEESATPAAPSQPTGVVTLSQIEAAVRQGNLVVEAARTGVSAAIAQRRIVAQVPNPALTAGAEQFPIPHPQRDIASDSPTASQHTYTLRLDQQIETGGKRSLRVAQAEHQVRSADQSAADALRLQLGQARTAFVAAMLARENVHIARDDLATIDQEESSLDKQVAAGNLPENDLIKFQVTRVDAEKNLRSAQLQYAQSLSDLGVIVSTSTAMGPNSITDVTGDMVTPAPLPSAESVVEGARSRPDVEALRASMEAARRGFDLARALRSPDPTIGAEYQRIGGDNTVGIVLSVPLPLYANHGGDIALASAQLHQAELQYLQGVRQAQADIEKAHAALVAARGIADLYVSSVIDKARMSLERVEHAYEHGSAGFVDLAEARRAYSQVRAAEMQAHADAWNAFYQLESACGHDLSDAR